MRLNKRDFIDFAVWSLKSSGPPCCHLSLFQVGMMRFGRLLAEDAPSALIQTYGQASLESVFLTLCMDNGDTDEESRDRSKENSIELENIVSRENNEVDNIVEAKPGAAPTNLPQSPTPRVQRQQENMCYDLLKLWRVRALLVKNFVRMWRNLGFLVFQFLIPTVQVSRLY